MNTISKITPLSNTLRSKEISPADNNATCSDGFEKGNILEQFKVNILNYGKKIKKLVNTALGAVIGGAIGGAGFGIAGAVMGAKAGYSGEEIIKEYKSHESILTRKVIRPFIYPFLSKALLPVEFAGIKTHVLLERFMPDFLAKIGAGIVGFAGGTAAGLIEGLVLGAAGGGLYKYFTTNSKEISIPKTTEEEKDKRFLVSFVKNEITDFKKGISFDEKCGILSSIDNILEKGYKVKGATEDFLQGKPLQLLKGNNLYYLKSVEDIKILSALENKDLSVLSDKEREIYSKINETYNNGIRVYYDTKELPDAGNYLSSIFKGSIIPDTKKPVDTNGLFLLVKNNKPIEKGQKLIAYFPPYGENKECPSFDKLLNTLNYNTPKDGLKDEILSIIKTLYEKSNLKEFKKTPNITEIYDEINKYLPVESKKLNECRLLVKYYMKPEAITETEKLAIKSFINADKGYSITNDLINKSILDSNENLEKRIIFKKDNINNLDEGIFDNIITPLRDNKAISLASPNGKAYYFIQNFEDLFALNNLTQNNLEFLSNDQKESFAKLKALEENGVRFHFHNKDSDLSTNSIGALINLISIKKDNHASITLYYPNGENKEIKAIEEIKNLKDINIDPETKILSTVIDKLDSCGYHFFDIIKNTKGLQGDLKVGYTHPRFKKIQANLNDNEEGSMNSAILKNLTAQILPNGKPLYQGKEGLINALNSGKLVEFTEFSNEISINKEQFIKLGEMASLLPENPNKMPMFFQADSGLGMITGFLTGYELIRKGKVIAALSPNGSLVYIKTLEEFKTYLSSLNKEELQNLPDMRPKQNLQMCYYVSPFDPVGTSEPMRKVLYELAGIGLYDLQPLVHTKSSNGNTHDVIFRSDLPGKKNLRLEIVENGSMNLIKKAPPETMMSDPDILSDFVYNMLKTFPDDKHIRFIAAGHGGADVGLLPDDPVGGSAEVHKHPIMGVDSFAKAIHEGIEKAEKETGKTFKIDNIVLNSCLMANSSFIYALSKYGDISFLNASAAPVSGSPPQESFEYLSKPENTDASAEKFAKDMVDIMINGKFLMPEVPGDDKSASSDFALTYGAYRLDPEKNKVFSEKVKNMFNIGSSHTDEEFFSVIKDIIFNCPLSAQNTPMPGPYKQRDLVLFCRNIISDKRINDEEFKKAAKEVIDAVSDFVVVQKGKKGKPKLDKDEKPLINPETGSIIYEYDYTKDEGPSIYLPFTMYESKMIDTEFMKETSAKGFIQKVCYAQKLPGKNYEEGSNPFEAIFG